MISRPKTLKKDKNYARNLRTQVEHLKTIIEVLYLFNEFDGNIKKISEFSGLSRNTIYKILREKEILKYLTSATVDED